MQEGKPKGWFSRKHQTSSAHIEAVENRNANRGRQARIEKAKERDIRREKYLAEEQRQLEERIAAKTERALAQNAKENA